jgi:hypothetical protein
LIVKQFVIAQDEEIVQSITISAWWLVSDLTQDRNKGLEIDLQVNKEIDVDSKILQINITI